MLFAGQTCRIRRTGLQGAGEGGWESVGGQGRRSAGSVSGSLPTYGSAILSILTPKKSHCIQRD